MDKLCGATLVSKTGEKISADEYFKDATAIGYYFSAHWCPPCRMFTPVLKDFYENVKDKKLPFEIVFVSSDRSFEDMIGYMEESHGDWCAVEWNSELSTNLKHHFAIRGIPCFIIVKKDGTVITKEGREAVQTSGPQICSTWC